MPTDEPAEEVVYPHEVPRPDNVAFHPKRCEMDLPVEDILRAGYNADLLSAVVVGTKKNGKQYLAATNVDAKETLYMLHRAIHTINMLLDDIQAEIKEDGDEDPDAIA